MSYPLGVYYWLYYTFYHILNNTFCYYYFVFLYYLFIFYIFYVKGVYIFIITYNIFIILLLLDSAYKIRIFI